MNDLNQKHCVPCEGGVDPLSESEIENYKAQLNNEWSVIDNTKLRRQFRFETFLEAIEFVNKIAPIAEREQHHPDIYVFFNKVQIELFTHAIGGLHENDFIMASKIDHTYEQ
jgi:4a-hydroxytetrahydrobiopterin dehydratase